MRSPVPAVTVIALAACTPAQLGDAGQEPAVSPGTVTLNVQLSSALSFCDQTDGCSAVTHVWIGKEVGNWLALGPGGGCAPQCASGCTPPRCPLIPPCMVSAVSVGVPVTSFTTTWDGSYFDWSTCGAGTACFRPHFVRPGRYVARFCATPGTLDGNQCTPTGAQLCVDMPFDLPGPSPLDVSLPMLARG